jgi:hypothetical protein
MNVETGAEAALFPGKEYINAIFVAVLVIMSLFITSLVFPGGRGSRLGLRLLWRPVKI